MSQNESAPGIVTGESAVHTAAGHVYAALLLTDVAGQTIERDILRDSTIVGAARGCDLRLKSDCISPVHCIITLDHGTLRIRDLGTTQGTRVNGERVKTAVLSDGDYVQLGRHQFRVDTNLPGQGFRGFYIDIFQVTEILGSGGMCWIYGARNSITREKLALKVLPSHHSPRMLTHFGIEARVGMRVRHPNLIHMQKIAQWESLFFIVMEYIEAVSLQEHIEEHGPLNWRAASSLGMQVARGLQHLHENKVVHRDLKPANVLCQANGQVKVIDFGLAMLGGDDEQERLSAMYAEQILGTADYISPEQSRRSHAVDGRADLYSLGCLLYYAATGTVLFPMSPVRDKIKAHRHQKPRDPREIVPGISESFATVVLKLLEKDPQQRPATAAEVAEILAPLSEPLVVRFDWQAILSTRAVSARRRLAKLLAKRRQVTDTQAASTVVLDAQLGDSSSGESRPERPIEVDFMEFLRDDNAVAESTRAEWGDLFEVWTQLPEERRREILATCRRIERELLATSSSRTSKSSTQ